MGTVMGRRAQTMTVAACLAMLAAGGTNVPLYATHIDTEEDLLPRIQQEHDPVKKAKFEIRLARVKLLEASGSCRKDEHDICKKSLGSYLELLRSSWNDLKSSGKNAVKHPSGFRELDIALREDSRTLDDSKREIPIEDRGTFDPVIAEVNKIHDEVFAALFPDSGPRPQKKNPAQAHFAPGGIE
jgi:hypothetical protein